MHKLLHYLVDKFVVSEGFPALHNPHNTCFDLVFTFLFNLDIGFLALLWRLDFRCDLRNFYARKRTCEVGVKYKRIIFGDITSLGFCLLYTSDAADE